MKYDISIRVVDCSIRVSRSIGVAEYFIRWGGALFLSDMSPHEILAASFYALNITALLTVLVVVV